MDDSSQDLGFFRVILSSIADGVFTVDKDWRITSFNKAAQEITGVSEEEAVGSACCDVWFRISIKHWITQSKVLTSSL